VRSLGDVPSALLANLSGVGVHQSPNPTATVPEIAIQLPYRVELPSRRVLTGESSLSLYSITYPAYLPIVQGAIENRLLNASS